MIEESPDVYFYPRYVGGSGWVGILLDQIADDALENHLREARRIIASKRKPARKPRGMQVPRMRAPEGNTERRWDVSFSQPGACVSCEPRAWCLSGGARM